MPAAPTPAYIERGDRVEARQAALKQRLGHLHDAVWAQVKRDAPDLLPTLRRVPPALVPHGYQILPRLVADDPAPAARPRSTPRSYSWPWTEQLIERASRDLSRSEARLEHVAELAPPERRAVYEELIATYVDLASAQRTIDAHIQYNRLWQAAIARVKPGYDRQTVLLRAVLERQAIRDALALTDDAGFRKAVAGIAGLVPSTDRRAVEAALEERETRFSGTIHDATDRIAPPAFVRVEQPAPHQWIVRVPFYTDIEETEFVERFKDAVESVWRLRDGGDEFRVLVPITYIPSARLYGREAPPDRGAQIDFHAQVARFPVNGAVLTTGATSTHVTDGRCIALGPHDVAPHVLAHEFGHMLGFRDVYFRGYRDLGADGYEVTEVIADPGDIMGAPGFGPVLRHHFERLVGSGASRGSARQDGDGTRPTP